MNILRAPIDRLAWVFAVSDDSSQRELMEVTLRNLCRTLDFSAAAVCLLDGSAVILDAGLSTRGNDGLRITYAPRTDALPPCAHGEAPGTGPACSGNSLCPSGERLGSTGFRTRVCSPLKLGSTLVGQLLVMDESPRELSASELEYIANKGTQLILRLHHTFYFPEVCSELVALEHSISGAYKESVVDRMDLGRDSTAYRVLRLARLNHLSSIASLTRSLPKGINWPTLRSICQYLDHSRMPVSRRDVSSAVGVSDVTEVSDGYGFRPERDGLRRNRATNNHVSTVEKKR